MAKIDIETRYSRWSQPREDFLTYAEESAALVMPSMKPKGDARVQSERPFTQLGTQALRSLSASIHRITMPPQVKWLKMDIKEDVRAQIEMQAAATPFNLPMTRFMDDRLAMMEDTLIQDLGAMTARSKIASAILRNLVEGNTLIHVGSDEIRIFPLRNFVVFRESGRIRSIIAREEVVEDYRDRSPPQSDQDRQWLYTEIDYEHGTVRQQVSHSQTETAVNSSPDHWFVFVATIPDVEHYATSYVWEHLGVIHEINHLRKSLSEAAAVAAWNIPVIREGAAITPDDLKDRASGEPIMANPEDLSWFTSGTKVGDWGFVANYSQILREELSALFALGIKDRVTRAATATEILQISAELDTHTQDLLTAYEETLQRPLVRALMSHHGYDQIRMPNGDTPFEVIITTGQSALQREAAFTKLVQVAGMVKQMDPLLDIDGEAMMNAGGNAMQFPTDGFFSRQQPQQAAGGPGQAPALPNISGGNQDIPPPGQGGPQPQQPEQPPVPI